MNTTLPTSSGIYLFKDNQNKIIYIGKAKNLRTRVGSYFQKRERDLKIDALIQEHITIDYLITKNETEALLLEAELIQLHQPKYNVLLKGGQPFVYLLFTQDDPVQLKIVRNKKEKGVYFGPFIHKTHARSVYNFLLHTFKLRLCKKKIAQGCLDYHLGTCAGSCRQEFDEQDYLFRLQLAQDTLRRNHKQFLKNLNNKITEHTKGLDFEKAQQLAEYVKHWETIFTTIKTKFNPDRFLADLLLVATRVAVPDQVDKQTQELQAFLHTSKSIKTIDCFDISHFQSHSLVGSCIRFTNGMPDKNKFRKFKIKTLSQQDDCAALQEIVSRRYKDLDDVPDLILIDGGKGQLNAIKKILPEADIVALAKREERLYSSTNPEGTLLNMHSSVGRLLIALRDYTHHFAISYHRKRRHKELVTT